MAKKFRTNGSTILLMANLLCYKLSEPPAALALPNAGNFGNHAKAKKKGNELLIY